MARHRMCSSFNMSLKIIFLLSTSADPDLGPNINGLVTDIYVQVNVNRGNMLSRLSFRKHLSFAHETKS